MKSNFVAFLPNTNWARSVLGQLLFGLAASIFALGAAAQNGEVEEVVIYQEYIPDEKLETADISDLLDADDMSIAGDSNVGEALKRLPGLSLVDGKFIYVRGLGDRYSSTYFNGAPMPGLEPLTRAVPLDLFDSSVISNLLVQKTYSANYSSEFTGGAVDIRSEAIPNENGFDFKIKTAHNSESTGKTRWTYDGGGRDWTGFDDGTRSLPGLVEPQIGNVQLFTAQDGLSAMERDRLLFSFSEKNNVWDIESDGNNPVDTGLSAAFKRRWDDHGRVSVGLIATLSYDHKLRNRFEDRYRWNRDLILDNTDLSYLDEFGGQDAAAQTALRFGNEDVDGDGSPDNVLTSAQLSSVGFYQRTQRQVDLNSLVSLGFTIDDVHEIKLTKMLLRKSIDEASVTATASEGGGSFRVVERSRLVFEENEIDFSQISGEHYFGETAVNWRYSLIDGSRDLPDERVLPRFTAIDTGEMGAIGTNPSRDLPLRPQRTYTFLDDATDDFGIDITIPATSPFIEEMDINLGYSRTEKKRDYDAFRISYDLFGLNDSGFRALFGSGLPGRAAFNDFREQDFSIFTDSSGCTAGGLNDFSDNCFLHMTASPNTRGAIAVNSGFSAPYSEYSGSVVTEAAYFVADLNLSEQFRFNVGLRRENYVIGASVPLSPRITSTSLSDLNPELSSKGVYPSAKFTWNFAENMALRAAYSETQNRPNLNELIPVEIINTKDGRTYRGNENLVIADITSYDIRYEWYFGDQDYLSLTAFEKQIDNPIETENDERTGLTVTTWVNHQEAANEGYEFEIRKYVGEYFSVVANATRIHSSVDEIRRDSNGMQTEVIEDSRALQGLSKELYNAQLVYQDDTTSVSLTWNYFSKRISTILGQNAGVLYIYEEPRDTVDFNLKHSFYTRSGELGVGFKVSNILDEETSETYANGLIYDRYKSGQTFGLSLSWKQ